MRRAVKVWSWFGICEQAKLYSKMRIASATLSFTLWLLAATSITTSATSITSATAATIATRNLTTFPACVTDIDCESVSLELSADFKCFQFMCFPWNNPDLQSPYKTCQKNSDCNSLEMECFRHQDRRNVLHGICLHISDLLKCFSHTDCLVGQQCVVGWCGQPQYLEAIAALGCDSDSYCEDLLIGVVLWSIAIIVDQCHISCVSVALSTCLTINPFTRGRLLLWPAWGCSAWDHLAWYRYMFVFHEKAQNRIMFTCTQFWVLTWKS